MVSVLSDHPYLQDGAHACPRQADVHGVNIGDNVLHSLEPVQKPHGLVCLLGKVYLPAFVVPRPSLELGAPLKIFA